MVEKKIYNGYAFTDEEAEKAKANNKIYRELMGKHKVFRHDTKLEVKDGTDCNFDDYDIVIGRKAGYAHAIYKVHKNTPNLSTAELALICDQGNLCFGYGMQVGMIRISED